MKRAFLVCTVILLILLFLCACSKPSESQKITTDYSTSVPQTTAQYDIYTEQFSITSPESHTAFENTLPASETYTVNDVTDSPAPETTQQAPTVTEQETTLPQTTEKVYEKTGEMAFSDSADNKYIKAIVNKYGVDAKNLAVLYTVPDNDGNIVLEFDGSVDNNGKLIRNEDTLIAIYSIDRNLNSKRASENSSLNEYSYGEMKVMFISTTKYIMPEFQNELNG